MNESFDVNSKLQEMGKWIASPQASSETDLRRHIAELSSRIPQMTLPQRQTFFAHLRTLADQCQVRTASVGQSTLSGASREALSGLSGIVEQVMDDLRQVYLHHPKLLESDVTHLSETPNPAIFTAFTNCVVPQFENRPDPFLLHTVIASDAPRIPFFLRYRSDVNINQPGPPPRCYTPLQLAIVMGKSEMVHQLLEAGADPLLKDGSGRNALDLAMDSKRSDLIRMLLNVPKDHPHFTYASLIEPFWRAVDSREPEPSVIAALRQALLSSLRGLDESELGQFRAAWLAKRPESQGLIARDEEALLEQDVLYNALNQPESSLDLISLFLNPNVINAAKRYQGDQTLLQRAAQNGDVSVLRSLRAILAPRHLQDLLQQQSAGDPRETALIIASTYGHPIFVGELIACGALRVGPLDQGMKAIRGAWYNPANNDKLESLLRLFIAGGLDCNQRFESDGTTLLILAIKEKRSVVGVLLELGADPNLVDDSGQTALHYVSDIQSVQQLIAHQADCNIPNRDRKCPLHVAIDANLSAILSVLLEHTSAWVIQDMFERFDAVYTHDHPPLQPGQHSPAVNWFVSIILQSHHPQVIRDTVRTLGPYIQAFLPQIYQSQIWTTEIQKDPTLMHDLLKLRDREGKTILFYDVSSPDSSWLRSTPAELLGEALTVKDRLGNTVLTYAAKEGNPHWLQAVPPEKLIHALKNERGQSPLLMAAESGKREFFLEAINLVAKYKPEAVLNELPFIRGTEGRSALHLIVHIGDIGLCRELHTRYPQLFKQLRQQRDLSGRTPIELALREKNPIATAVIHELLFDQPELAQLVADRREAMSSDEIANVLAHSPDSLMSRLKVALVFQNPRVMTKVLMALQNELEDNLMDDPAALSAALQAEPEVMRAVLTHYLPRLDQFATNFKALNPAGMRSLTQLMISRNPAHPEDKSLVHMAIELGRAEFLTAFPPPKLLELLESRSSSGTPLLFRIVGHQRASETLFALLKGMPPGWEAGRIRRLFFFVTAERATLVHQALWSKEGEHFLTALANFDPQLFNELILVKGPGDKTVGQWAWETSDINLNAFRVLLGDESRLARFIIENKHVETLEELRGSIETILRDPQRQEDVPGLLRIAFVMGNHTLTEMVVAKTIESVLIMPAVTRRLLAEFPDQTRQLLSEHLGRRETRGTRPLVVLVLPSEPDLLNELLSLRDNLGNTILHYAVLDRNMAVLDRIPRQRLFEALSRVNNDGESPLMLAALYGESRWCVRAFERLREPDVHESPAAFHANIKQLLSIQTRTPPPRTVAEIAIERGVVGILTALHALDRAALVELLKRPGVELRLIDLSVNRQMQFATVSAILKELHRLEPGLSHQLLSKGVDGTLITKMLSQRRISMGDQRELKSLLETLFSPTIGSLIFTRQTDFQFRAHQAVLIQTLTEQLQALNPTPPLLEMLEVPLLLGFEDDLLFRPLNMRFQSQIRDHLFTEGWLRQAVQAHPAVIKRLLRNFPLAELSVNQIDRLRGEFTEIQVADPSFLAKVFQTAEGDSIFHGEFTAHQRNLLKVLPAAAVRALLEKRNLNGRTPLHVAASRGQLHLFLEALPVGAWDANDRRALSDIMKLKTTTGKTVLYLLLTREAPPELELIGLRDFDPALFREMLHTKDNFGTTPCCAAIYERKFDALASLFHVLGFPNDGVLTTGELAALIEGHLREIQQPNVVEYALDRQKIGRALIQKFNQERPPIPLVLRVGLLDIPALLGEESVGRQYVLAGIRHDRLAELLTDENELREAFRVHPQEMMQLLQYQNWEGRTVLHRAAAAGHVQLFQHLARINPALLNELVVVPDKRGDTLVHVAAASGQTRILQELRNMGGAIEETLDYLLVTKGSLAKTPLQQALAQGMDEVAVHILRNELPALNEERNRLAVMLDENTASLSLDPTSRSVGLQELQVEQRRLMDGIRSLNDKLVLKKRQDPDFKPKLVLPSDRELSRWGLTQSHLQLGFGRRVPSVDPDINITALIDLYESIPRRLRDRLSATVSVEGVPQPRFLVTDRIFATIRALQANTELRDSYGNPLSVSLKESISNVCRHFVKYFQGLKAKMEAEIQTDSAQADSKMRDFLDQLEGFLITRMGEANFNCLDRMALESRNLYFELIERDTSATNQDLAFIIHSHLMQFRQGLFEIALTHLPNVTDRASTQRYYERLLAKLLGLPLEMSKEQSIYEGFASRGHEQQILGEVHAAYSPTSVRRHSLEMYRGPPGEAFDRAVPRKVMTTDLSAWLSLDWTYDYSEVMTEENRMKRRRADPDTVHLFHPKVFYMRLKDIGVLCPMNALGEDLGEGRFTASPYSLTAEPQTPMASPIERRPEADEKKARGGREEKRQGYVPPPLPPPPPPDANLDY